MDTGKVVLGALAGLAAGAILGILFAPEKGSDTRKKIASKGKDTVDGLKEKVDGLKEKYNGVIDNLNSKLESVKNGSQNYFEEGKELAQTAKNNVENAVR